MGGWDDEPGVDPGKRLDEAHVDPGVDDSAAGGGGGNGRSSAPSFSTTSSIGNIKRSAMTLSVNSEGAASVASAR